MSVERLEREKEEIKQRFAELCSQFRAIAPDPSAAESESEADKKLTEIAACQRRLYYVERDIERAKLDLMPDRSLTGIERSRISSATPPPQIQWTNRLKAQFCDALLDTYPRPPKLRKFLAEEIDESLDRLSSEGDLEARCFEAIEALDARGEKLDDLYFAFREENPAKPFVIPRSQMPDIGIEKEPERDRLPPREPQLLDVPRDRRPAHLIVYVTSSFTDPEHSVLVRAELHFERAQQIPPEPIDLLPEESIADSESSERAYKITDLAAQLERACHKAAMRLRALRRERRFQGSLKPIVELFLPLHLLGNSLATWCRDGSKLPASYPIVVRSSERIQDESLEAITAYDNLEEAWATFFPAGNTPRPGAPAPPALHELPWRKSIDNDRDRPDFRNCVGVQCFGHWLTPKSAQWATLIEMGTPFAFWLCDCDILPAERHAIFDRLTAGDRFQLLSAICDERHRSASPNVPPGDYHHLGVFYEDINYLPTVSPFYEDLAS